jgi:Carboxypeptidase regulatory-like domain/TonB-dependent Receptor Plug Domain
MNRERRTRLLRIVRTTLTFGFTLLLVATSLFAQTTTGNISGSVRASDGSLLPGVTVTATSPSLQGSRVGYTGDNGDYILRGLPPGEYTVKFEMSGLTGADKKVNVELGQTAALDVQLNPATKTETITVVASAPSALTTTQLGANYKQETITSLPMPRTLSGIAALTPGVNTNTFNVGQVRINGAFAYDNVFLVDGTDVNDNLFGTANNLYIEDAVAETQVLTGGVSAEYGRFTGGVVNAITKSGGNDFTGTLRTDFSKGKWTSLTPTERVAYENNRKNNPTVAPIKADTLNKTYQGTLGGPILRDRLWFFLAGRNLETASTATLTETGLIIPTGTENPRYEGKVTASLFSKHTVQASYLTNDTTQIGNQGLAGIIDPRSVVTRTLPNERMAAFYNGVITPSLFAEVKYSEKKFGFRGTGGTSTDVHDSPILNRTGGQRLYNAPYFSSLDPEDRNNEDFAANLSYFLSTRATGSHDIKGGYEFYRSTRTGGNSQSSTNFVFGADPKRSGGVAVTDSAGRYIPLWQTCIPNAARTGCTNPTGSTWSTMTNWIPTIGAKVDIDTAAYFINDTWNLNKHFSFNLGYRYEQVDGSATGDITTVDSSRGTPRLGASFDVRGDGRTKIDATAAQYSGRYSERQFATNSPVGNPSAIAYAYIGPAGEGINYAPAFDLNNYIITGGSFPLQNIFVADDIKSPVVDEYTFSVGQALSTTGFVKATYTNRKWESFWEDFIGTSGFTTIKVPNSTIQFNSDNILFGNTDEMEKEFAAISLLAQYRPLSRWTTQINYTRELKNDGNFVGEAGNQPGNASLFGDRPALYNENIHFPTGRLPGYQKDRIRWFNTFAIPLSKFGAMDLGVIYNYDSPLTFSYAAAVSLTPAQIAARDAAGYKNAPSSTTVFFGERGSGTFRASQSLDLALTYSLPLFGSRVAPWVKAQMTNVTNRDALIQWNTTVIADTASPKESVFGLPTRYLKCGVDVPATTGGCGGITFGTPVNNASFQAPRVWDFAVGLRF